MRYWSREFLERLAVELEDRGERKAAEDLVKMKEAAARDPSFRARLEAWITCPDHADDLAALLPIDRTRSDAEARHRSVDAIETAAAAVRAVQVKTARTVEDRLFPSLEWDTGWHLSLQADQAGYQCSPREKLANLEDYDTIEAVIHGPFPEPVDPRTMDLPPEVVGKFTVIDRNSSISIGCNLSWEDISAIRDAINRASMNPNSGIPRGDIGWSGRTVWHGTDTESGQDIMDHGIRMAASSMGYFGRAFYVADDRALAVSNYANAADDDAAVVIKAVISSDAKILDLRNAEDYEVFAPYAGREGEPDFDRIMRRAGIGGIYDRAVGGLAIYDPNAISIVSLEYLADPETDPEP